MGSCRGRGRWILRTLVTFHSQVWHGIMVVVSMRLWIVTMQDVELPEIKTIGTYDASVKLHPEVSGTFKVVVQKLKEQK